MFVFDETFRALQGQGSAIDLTPWYSQGEISIMEMKFACGSDEVALVDSSAQVRIFSFVTLQFRFVSSPLYKSYFPCPSQHSLVDRRLCSSKLPQMPYSHRQMGLASSSSTLLIPEHHSLRIIWRHLGRLREFP